MIRNDKEYREALERLQQEKDRLNRQKEELRTLGLGPAQIKRALDPMRSFHQQLEEEVAAYERLLRGEFAEIENLHGLGQLLISLRIARGFTQRELAEKLGVHETQVSRDERNEYHGITLERAARLLEALGVQIRSHVEWIDGGPAEAA